MDILQLGSKGDTVSQWQTLLNGLGYSCDVDGQFGPKTKLATLSFQTNHNLLGDGIVGEATWAEAKSPTIKAIMYPGGPMDERSEKTMAGMVDEAIPFFRALRLEICNAIYPHVWKWTSGYRSPEEQAKLWDAYKNNGGPRAAPPWGSFHQTGLAADGTVFRPDGNPIWDGIDYDVAVRMIQSSNLKMHSGHSYGDDPHVMKFPPSLEISGMSENGVLWEVRRRIENNIPIWP